MADFRKMLFVLAGLLILIGTASAQTGITCTAFVANQPTLRQEGITEPAGDILITCSGTPIGAQLGPQTLTLYTNGVPITSRQLYTGSAPASIPTEAALLVNDCTTNSGTSSSGGTCGPNGNPTAGANSLPTQGFIQNNGTNTVVFSGFYLPGNGSTFQIRVTNVRVNANSVSSGTFITGTILATFGIQNQQNLVLGAVQSSLSVSVKSNTFAQCTSTPTSGTVVTTLTVKELVNTAFKSPKVLPVNSTPGQWYQNGVNTESQTVLTGTSFINALGSTPGQADWATRFRVSFSGIPAGVTLSLPATIGNADGTAPSAIATTGGDTGILNPASSSITLSADGSVTYEITAQNGSAIDSFTVPVTVTYKYSPPNTPATGNINAAVTYAPTGSEITALNSQPGVPKFADTSASNSAPFIVINPCSTDLLFTFLTNQAGFDTGFEIANTSADPFGTLNQNGTCVLNWYGTGPGNGTTTTTPSIAAGTVYTNLVSTANAGFQGYMIAVCNFQYGHGFAFISDGYGQPGRGLSQGYLASVIPTPGLTSSSVCGTTGARCAADASKSTVGQGEQLNQ